MASKQCKNIQHKIEYIFVRAGLLLIWSVSLKTALMIGDVIGWLAFSVLRVRRKVALDNLAMAFPEKSESERLGIARRAYQNFTKMTLEYMRFPLLDKETVLSSVKMKNPDQDSHGHTQKIRGLLVGDEYA